jgi:hypothetical protein
MNKIFKIISLNFLIITVFCLNSWPADKKYSAVDEFAKPKFSISPGTYFKVNKLPSFPLNFADKDLLKVLLNTREYYEKHLKEDPVVKREGVLGSMGITLSDILKTIDYMIRVLEEDISAKRTTRLKDPAFINSNFKVIRWYPYNPADPKQKEQIRITKYAIFTHEGSKVKTAKFNIPLYALKTTSDKDLFYKEYTKQYVLSGIYEKGGKEYGKAVPLVYLTREGLEEALMEGTLLVKFPDGSSQLYNVDKNNGVAYVKGLNPKQQKRYWYFKAVKSINGYGNKIENRIKVEPGVTFAGDVFNIGVGRIVTLEYTLNGKKMLKLGIIADTGGAFLPNLHQLDFLAGIFKTRNDFVSFSKSLPPYVNVYFLIKK